MPDEIGNLKVLRVLSIRHNKLKVLPLCIGSLKPLRVLRLLGNPWTSDLAEILHEGELSYQAASPGNVDDSECDRFTTPSVMDYLRRKQRELSVPSLMQVLSADLDQ